MSAVKEGWSERKIAAALARHTFQRRHLVMVPNCNWTGYECDLLVLTKDLRIIDVEVKISRSDLKADAKKDKWWRRFGSVYDPEQRRYVERPKQPLEHPIRVWKHYFAMPAEIWDDSLLQFLPSQASGVILVRKTNSAYRDRMVIAEVVRRAKPNRDAQKLSAEHAVDLARLASLRLWDTYDALDQARKDGADWRERALEAGFKFDWEKPQPGVLAGE